MPAALRRPYYYGWTIVAACFVVTTFAYGVQYSFFGVFLNPLKEDFEWTPATIAWVPSLFMFFICVFGLFAGWFTDRFGPRLIVGIGGFFIGLGLVLTSLLTAPWQIYVYYSLMVGFGTGCVGPPIFTTVSRWFVERRGLALGIVATGIGLGTIIIAPAARWLISEYDDDWRFPCRVIGFAAWAIIAAALLLKKEPGEAPPHGRTNDQTRDTSPGAMEGLTLAQAVRTNTLWLLILLHIFAFTGLLMVMYHVVAYAQDMGIAKMTAATLLSVIGGVGIAGRIGGGIASDRLGRKPIFIFALLVQGAMMLWLWKSTSVGTFYVFAAIWGLGYGAWAPLMPALTAELFGLRHMGSILGLVSASFGIGGILGPAIAGNTYTDTDSYSTAFLIGGVVMFLGAMIIPFLKPPKVAEAY